MLNWKTSVELVEVNEVKIAPIELAHLQGWQRRQGHSHDYSHKPDQQWS